VSEKEKEMSEKCIQMSLPLMPPNIDDLWVDQSITNVDVADRNFFAAYTPYGIKMIDSRFGWRIRKLLKTDDESIKEVKRMSHLSEWGKEEYLEYIGESPENIRNDILSNIHLHACIKKNLIENLDNYLRIRNDRKLLET
jgi:hypothetical protein